MYFAAASHTPHTDACAAGMAVAMLSARIFAAATFATWQNYVMLECYGFGECALPRYAGAACKSVAA